MSYQQSNKGDGISRPTKWYRARKTNQRAAWNKNHLSAETISAAAFAPNVHMESSWKHNSNTTNAFKFAEDRSKKVRENFQKKQQKKFEETNEGKIVFIKYLNLCCFKWFAWMNIEKLNFGRRVFASNCCDK